MGQDINIKKLQGIISFLIVSCVLFTSCGRGSGSISTGGSTQNNPVVTPAVNASILISAGLNGLPSDGISAAASVSADGRYVVFESNATNLVSPATNGVNHIFLRDLTAGTTSLVSVSSAGVQGNSISSAPAISSDGRYVAFESRSTNLVVPAANGVNHIFLRDLTAGTTSLVSVSSAGVQGNSISSAPAISSDGKYVAFESRSTNLVIPATNGLNHIFLRDLTSGTTSLLSVNITSTPANGNSSAPAITADGKYVAFESNATDLIVQVTFGVSQIFLRDLAASTTSLVSVNSIGSQGNGPSFAPAISADGRYVAFESFASNLTGSDINALKDIFVRDLGAAATVLVSVSSGGVQGNSTSSAPAISADGRYVAFESLATNLVSPGTNGVSHIFVYDLNTGLTALVSASPLGTEGNAGSFAPAITGDGGFIAYESNASNLIDNDTNALKDIFIYAQ